MSTRAYVTIADGLNIIRLCSVQHDGYPAHLGQVLLRHYCTDNEVNALISLSDIDTIDGGLDTVEVYDDARVVTFKVLDKPSTTKDIIDFCKKKGCAWMEYYYVWNVSKQKWYYLPANQTRLRPLTKNTGVKRFKI